MNYQHIKKRLDAKDIIVLDGGTGTELQRRGAQMTPLLGAGLHRSPTAHYSPKFISTTSRLVPM